MVVRPVDLVNQPAPFQDRYKILQKLLEVLEKVKPNAKGKLNKLATGLELRVAKSSKSPQSYKFNMSILLRDLNKFHGDLSKIKIGHKPIAHSAPAVENKATRAQAMEKLKSILIDSDTLEKNGYITSIGSAATATATASASGDAQDSQHAICIRCNTKFDKSEVMKKSLCRYHPLKKEYDRESKIHQYPCCGETTDSSSFLRLGCQNRDHHVFREQTYEGMSSISEFKDTRHVEGPENVLALDCEMAYTSLGYEMIRLTIVDFFTSKTLFDEIVRPIGQVIDLNSQFSGVHEIKESESLSYEECMQKVLTESLINKNSILIGHGLENDVNVMRIFHRKIIDTAILYSNGRFKTSLKNLAFENVNRKIQSGEHDSSEDAIATMDVVKSKIGIPIAQKEWD
ncbi:hypothetical protein ZYGR_0N02620 [Zygosaccharomyces rouxii]|uniref:RNA exonuclease 3 n=2 Tax=Zygosaccharomyces rouxii TaxID=4956 RepID=C5DVF7_ZYGRC|nr:uncharacterized protein ZYRO0D06358g [Zygosaccharomyces rouxii]KAH9200689.1 ribonuclease H-like domain-containing protein [Zygosaccharomyces rouxii]GAV48857.1 hypothetical protein ZYGR_0N02620 [Zygosaccharomyces rouxii]CAR27776.1 ZYRO0D06358p [Zygosaccharomyces rouxii]